MPAKALRRGLLAGSVCGILGAMILIVPGLSNAGAAPWLVYAGVPLLGGPLAAWLLRRAAQPEATMRRADLTRAGAVAGAAGGVWLGLLLVAQTTILVVGGSVEGQMRDLLARNGLAADSAQSLAALLLGCAGCFFILIMPVVTAGLGALAAGAYSFVRPAA